MKKDDVIKIATETIKAAENRINSLEYSPVAIIGFDCRFPGGANSPEEYWKMLVNGIDGISEVPKDRWDVDLYYHEDTKEMGKIATRYGGFINDIDQFDASFFNITPREAIYMDPQQRLLLEITWGALQSANIPITEIPRSKVGVYVGIFNWDYSSLILKSGLQAINAYYGTGNSASIASGRISYFLGARGPCISTDTACSSSLVAIVQACNDLRTNKCRTAICGGVNLIIAPEISINFSKANMLAPDGRCKTFDSRANGYSRGEGCGIIILKKLDDAIKDGDTIHAVIRGAAVNHDGASSGLTVPSEHAQIDVIREAIANAHISPSEVSYVEAHGTGTSLGDPIEFRALQKVYSQGRDRTKPLMIGSVKTNIGHLEPAAGIAGIIKILLAMKHKKIPKNLHYLESNKEIHLEDLPATVPTELLDWKTSDNKLVAGISSFGFSGTNSHVILENYEATDKSTSKFQKSWHIINLSTYSQEAQKENTQLLLDYINENSPALADLAFSTAVSKSHRFHNRLAIVADSLEGAKKEINDYLADKTSNFIYQSASLDEPTLAFLFTGQGSQFVGMGQMLYESSPVFAKHMNECNEYLMPYLNRSIIELINSDEKTLTQTVYTQAVIFSVEYSLAKLWQSWGVTPDYLAGHSIGEIAAACFAGCFSLKDGCKLIAARGRLIQSLPEGGGMTAVMSEIEEIKSLLNSYNNNLNIAAINGPKQAVISGDLNELAVFEKKCEEQGAKYFKLPVSHAFHSALMEPILDDFNNVVDEIEFFAPSISMVSSVTGKKISEEILCNSEYWVKHIIETVNYVGALKELDSLGVTHYIEIGPQPILSNLAKSILSGTTSVFLPSMDKGKDEWKPLMMALAKIYVDGVNINWTAVNEPYFTKKIQLPRYPFQHKRYWLDMDEGIKHVIKEETLQTSDNLNMLYSEVLKKFINIRNFSTQDTALINDHRVYDIAIVPAAFYIEVAATLGKFILKSDNIILKNVFIEAPLELGKDTKKLESHLSYDYSEVKFELFSQGKRHMRCTMCKNTISSSSTMNLDAIKHSLPNKVDIKEFYTLSAEEGLRYESRFQGIKELLTHENQNLALIELPKDIQGTTNTYTLHPVVLDCALQSLVPLIRESLTTSQLEASFLPISFEEIAIYQPVSTSCYSHATLNKNEAQDIKSSHIKLCNDNGEILVEIKGYTAKSINKLNFHHLLMASSEYQSWLYTIKWEKLFFEKSELPLTEKLYLIFSNGQFDKKIEDTLKKNNNDIFFIAGGDHYHESDSHHITLPRGQKDKIEMLLNKLCDNKKVIDVLYLWPLDDVKYHDLPADGLMELIHGSCEELIYLIQILATRGQKTHVHIVTRGAHSVSSKNYPEQAVFYGLSRTLQNELEALDIHYHDLDPQSPTHEDFDGFLNFVSHEYNENIVCYRDSSIYGARWVHEPQKIYTHKKDTPLFKKEASYLITGGLGGLGLGLTEWMISEGAKNIILISRSKPKDTAINLIEELKKKNQDVRIITYTADVSDEVALSEVIRDIHSSQKLLHGIFHCAGALEDGIILNQSWERFNNVFKPKIAGAWNLHNITKALPLDYFVLFSSIVADAGYPGQSNYAAANAYLNSLAHYRKSLGLSALSVEWGPWANVGMAHKSNMKIPGLPNIEAKDGFSILASLLESDVTTTIVDNIDWDLYLKKYNDKHYLYKKCFGYAKGYGDADTLRDDSEYSENPQSVKSYQTPKETKPLEKSEELVAYTEETVKVKIKDIIRPILMLDSSEDVPENLGFTNLGMDSLMLMELKEKLDKNFKEGMFKSAADIFSYPNLKALAEHISKFYEKTAPSASKENLSANIDKESQHTTHHDLEDMVKNMSESDIDKMLDSILQDEDNHE